MENATTEILFEKFEIVKVLKRDLGTSVYLANHVYLNKKIILKTLNTDDLSENTFLQRFKREAKILAKLEHDNLIKVLDFGNYNNIFYISFEYFNSKNLRQVIKENELSIEQKTHLIVQLLEALNIAHQNQIIHRDIKPENILVNSNLDLKIADFGLALITNDIVLTHSSSIVGTPGYMSPEQIRGEKTPQTDLFSAGIVSYELFTGSNPFIGKNVSETINNILNFEEDKLLKGLAGLPENIQKTIMALLKKKLRERPKTALDVINILGIEDTFYNPSKIFHEQKNFRKMLYIGVPIIVFSIIIGLLIFGKTSGSSHAKKNLSEQVQNNPDNILNRKDDTLDLEAKNQTKESNKNTPGKSKIGNNNHKDSPNSNRLATNDYGSGLTPDRAGKLFIECSPWATIFIDGDSIDTTPISGPILLKPGKHKIMLVHDTYPPIIKNIKLNRREIDSLKINLDNLVGRIICNVEPWGKIYINGEYKGTTPIQPIILLPGNYMLKITNPNFASIVRSVNVNAEETQKINYHFKAENENN